MKPCLLALVFLLTALSIGLAQQPSPKITTNAPTANVQTSNNTPQIFWPANAKDWIDLVQGVSVIAASCFALYGINSWRREFIGKRRMELAEEVLVLFYQAKDIIVSMRWPTSYVSESAGRQAPPDETSKQKEIRDQIYVFFERGKQGDVFSRIHALRYRCLAQLGKKASGPFESLKSILDDLHVAANQWMMLSAVDVRHWDNPQTLNEHRDKIQQYDKELWSVSKTDPISKRLEKTIKDIENVCEPYIDRT